MTEITIVIPSGKKITYTKEINPWLKNFKTIVLKNNIGMAKAYNQLYRLAKSEIVVLAADDLWIDEKIIAHFHIKEKQFAMLETGDFPINGVQVIHKKDFWKVGGFNEKLKHGSVDHDFFCRCILPGLTYKPIPITLVKHVKHEKRASTIYKAFNVVSDRINFIRAYFIYFPKQVIKHDFINRLMRLQFRTILLNFLYFYRHLGKQKIWTPQ